MSEQNFVRFLALAILAGNLDETLENLVHRAQALAAHIRSQMEEES